MARAIENGASYDQRRSLVCGRIASGTDFLVGEGKLERGDYRVGGVGAEGKDEARS